MGAKKAVDDHKKELSGHFDGVHRKVEANKVGLSKSSRNSNRNSNSNSVEYVPKKGK